MNEQPLSKQDLELLERTRHSVSRHLDIPATPRDTMAVLRQAAEQEATSSAAPWQASGWFRFALAALLVLAVMTGALIRQTGLDDVASILVEAPDEAESVDPGIDLAAWNLEIETLMTEFDSSLSQLATDQADPNAWFEVKETSL